MAWSQFVSAFTAPRPTPIIPGRPLSDSYHDPLKLRDSFWREYMTLILGPSKPSAYHWTLRTNRVTPLNITFSKIIASLFTYRSFRRYAASIAAPCRGPVYRALMNAEGLKMLHQEAVLYAEFRGPPYEEASPYKLLAGSDYPAFDHVTSLASRIVLLMRIFFSTLILKSIRYSRVILPHVVRIIVVWLAFVATIPSTCD